MIRHYEEVGLLPQPRRAASGYRQYSENELGTLRFVRQARDLGFSIEQIRELLALWLNRRRPSREVKALAMAHIDALEQKLQDLQAVKATLTHLAARCHGDDRPECPILDSLGANTMAARPAAARPRASTRGLRASPRASR